MAEGAAHKYFAYRARLNRLEFVYSSQRRNNRDVLEHPIRKWRLEPVYQEILRYSYQDYLEKFLAPCYWCHGLELTLEALAKAGDLRTYAAGLQANPNIRLIVNRDDFLLSAEDLAWLQTTFTADQFTIFEQGGHLGNLSHPAAQKAIVEALDGLTSSPPKPR